MILLALGIGAFGIFLTNMTIGDPGQVIYRFGYVLIFVAALIGLAEFL